MFKIYAMICFLTIGPTDGTLCFKSEVPIKYKDLKNCSLDKKRLIDYLHEDLVDREITIIFKCSSEGSNV
jgi:hypothetical protein